MKHAPRLLTACVLGAALAAPALAAPWHVRTATNMVDGNPAALAMRGTGGVVVAWDATSLWLHEMTWDPATVPVLTVSYAGPFAASLLPRLGYDGVTALVTSGGGQYVRAVGAAVDQRVGSGFFDLTDAALDPGGSGRGVLAVGVIEGSGFETIATTTDSGATVSGRTVPGDPRVEEVAVNGSFGIGVVSAGAWVRSTDLLTWEFAPDPVAPGIVAQPEIGVSDLGVFVAVGLAGAAQVTSDPFVSIDDRTVAGAADFKALAFADGTSTLFIGDATGAVWRVDDPLADPWTLTPLGASGLDAVDGIAVQGTGDVVVVGRVGGVASFAWTNRAPTAPALSSDPLVLVEGGSAVLDASATDPDDETPTFSFSCADPSLSVTPVDADSAQIGSAPDPALCAGESADLQCTVSASDGTAPPAITPVAVTVTGVDNDGDPTLELFVIEDSMGIEVARLGAPTGPPIDEGSVLTARLLQATDDCPDVLRFQLFDLDDPLVPVLDESGLIAWDAPWTFALPVADGLRHYRVSALVRDTAGGTALASVDLDAQSLLAPEVSLACPTRADAGAPFVASATATNAAPRDSLTWTTDLGDGVASGDDFTVTTDACAPGTATVTVTPVGPTRSGATQTCAVIVDAVPTPPGLTVAEAPELVVPLGDAALDVTLHASVTDCAGETGTVRWDVSALPATLMPAAATDGVLETAPPHELVLRADAGALAALAGTSAEVVAVARDAEGAVSAPVSVTLSFVLDEDAVTDARIDVSLAGADEGAIEDGDLVALSGAITSDLAVAVPALSLALVGAGLVVVPESVEVTLACGGDVAVRAEADATRLTLEGVRAGCPARVRLLARRGVGPASLEVARCSWGPDDAPLPRCDGGLRARAPAALSCGAHDVTRGAPLVGLLLVLVVFGRAVSPSAAAARSRARRASTPRG